MSQWEVLRQRYNELTGLNKRLRQRVIDRLTMKQYTKLQKLMIGKVDWMDIDFSRVSKSRELQRAWSEYVSTARELRVLDRRLDFELISA